MAVVSLRIIRRVEDDAVVWEGVVNNTQFRVLGLDALTCRGCGTPIQCMARGDVWFFTIGEYRCGTCHYRHIVHAEEARLRRRDRATLMPNKLSFLAYQIATHRHYNRLAYYVRSAYEHALSEWRFRGRLAPRRTRKHYASVARDVWRRLYRC